MDKFFYPESVVVVGVSESPSNKGRKVLQNLARLGFKGDIYCIGRSEGETEGKRISTHLENLGSTPDLAVLLVPAEAILASLEDCGRKGISHAVIESAGFSEFQQGGGELETKIREVATKWNISVMGPNCVGTINMENGLALPFYPLEEQEMKPGRISFISQSGALLHDMMSLCGSEKLGFNKLVSIGNKLMLNENHFLEYLIADPNTHIIGLYLESVSDGRHLMELATSSEKPIIVLKANRSESSQQIAQFHTSSLMGDDQVIEAAIAQSGMHRAKNMMHMINLFKIFQLPILKGPNLLIISRSGGQAVIAADAVHDFGLKLAPLSFDFFNFMTRRFGQPHVINRGNPVDVGDIQDVESWAEIIEKGLEEKEVDGILLSPHIAWIEENNAADRLLKKINFFHSTSDKPILIFSLPGDKAHVDVSVYPRLFLDEREAVAVLKSSFAHYHAKMRRMEAPVRMETVSMARKDDLKCIMPVDETFRLLRAFAVPVVDYAFVSNVEEGLSAVRTLGYPVAVKIATPGVLHKTEEAGVQLNIRDEEALKSMLSKSNRTDYIIQRMISGHEFFIGAKRDREFGPVILFGIGGVLVELLRDVAIRFVPIDKTAAFEMLAEIRASAILNGYRGSKALDKQAVARCLLAISKLMSEHPEILKLDLNPLMVLEDGKGCFVVDAKMEKYA